MRVGHRLIGSVRNRVRRGSALWRVLKGAQQLLGIRPTGRLDGLLSALAAQRPEVFFVQVGSNDAGLGDPLRRFVVERGWRGILVEPVPYVFERLVKGYEAQSARLIFENVALADTDGSLPFYHVGQSDDVLPAWYDQIGSFDREHVMRHAAAIPGLEDRIVACAVPCRTFESLCRAHGVTGLDLVHVDTEGYDARVLAQIDLARYRPVVILYEHRHLSEVDRAACAARLAAAGYETLEIGPDTAALRTDSRPPGSRLARAWARLNRSVRGGASAAAAG